MANGKGHTSGSDSNGVGIFLVFVFTVLDTSAVLEITVINYIVLTRIAIIIIIIVVITDLIENSVIIKSSDYFLRSAFLPTRS